jgi:hypothetical protein
LFLAFPDDGVGAPTDFEGHVYGFDGNAGPHLLQDYTLGTHSPATGTGAAADPFTQTTTYSVDAGEPVAKITQTTTYVNGEQRFSTTWTVENLSGAALKYKALAAADLFIDSSDVGTGVFTQGPPRFIGGTNADTGRSGGFVEAGAPSPPWSAYEALTYDDPEVGVWAKVQKAAESEDRSFEEKVVGEPVDNAAGVEWDDQTLPAVGDPISYSLITRSSLPAALQITPPNAGSPQGVPIAFTATARDTDGTPFAGKSLRFTIVGANPLAGASTIDAAGNATVVDPGTNAGADTVIAFVDLNNNGTREPAEPQASALGTFVDKIAPSCKVAVSGDRAVAGGQGKPLVITVNCDSPATVSAATTLTIKPKASKSAATAKKTKRKKAKKIKLKPVTSTVAPGQATPVSVKIPKSVAKKYAGR